MAGDDASRVGHANYQHAHPAKHALRLAVESHAITTEGIAMMFERLAGDAALAPGDGRRSAEPEKVRRQVHKIAATSS